MKKVFGTFIVVLFFSAGLNAKTFEERQAGHVDCYALATLAEEACGGDNYDVFSAVFDSCFAQQSGE